MPPQQQNHEEKPDDLAVVRGEDFDVLLTDAQPRIRGYLASILGGWADADDLLQETNLVLIRKRDSFEPGTNFIAWAFRVAFFKATTWRRDRGRERRIVFSESAFQEFAAAAEEFFEDRPPSLGPLRECLGRLKPAERELVRVKYVERRKLSDHAVDLGCSASSLHKRISRIRLALRKCIQDKLRIL